MEENIEMNTEKVVEEVSEVVETKIEEQPKKPQRNNERPKRDRDNKRKFDSKDKKKLLEDKVISITRVTKATKGGRRFKFSATVVVGNRKGLVGIGSGKANEVQIAITKALQAANKNVVRVALIDNRTIPHEGTAKVGRAVVMIKPAREGRGIIAGGAARAVLELAGIRDIVSKSLGANTQINVAKATLEALKMQRTPERIAALRGKEVGDL